jgi:hypothetical protein
MIPTRYPSGKKIPVKLRKRLITEEKKVRRMKSGLPKSIIKKYGVSKKAWAVYRQQKGTTSRTTKKRKKRRYNMPKRKSYRRRARSGLGDMGMIVGGMAYGAARSKLSSLVSPITSKIPLGYTADNIVLGGISYLLMKGKIPFLNKIKMTRNIGKAGLILESALLGSEVISGTAGSTTANKTSFK